MPIKSFPLPKIYRIQTPRLVIRCWHPDDALMLKNAVDESRDHLKPWMPWAHGEPEPVEIVQMRTQNFRASFQQGIDFVFGIFNLAEDKVLGGTGLHTRVGPSAREIGYWIHAHHIGKGLATEVCEALMRVAFEIEEVGKMEIQCDPKNTASAAIPKKLKYRHVSTTERKSPDYPGQMGMTWVIESEQYFATRAKVLPISAWGEHGEKVI
jgi:RimJ/RimL family protein N-acetyltransferase